MVGLTLRIKGIVHSKNESSDIISSLHANGSQAKFRSQQNIFQAKQYSPKQKMVSFTFHWYLPLRPAFKILGVLQDSS